MNVFDTLFPARTPAAAGRPRQRRPVARGGRNRMVDFGRAERLERRDLLAAATLQQTTPNEFFIDLDKGRGITSEYATYTLSNGSTAYDDVWVQLMDDDGDVVHRSSHETGFYRIGPLAANATATAYFFFTTSSTGGPVSDSHTVKAFDGDPRELPSPTPFVVGTGTFVTVEEVLDAEDTKLDSITVSPTPAVLGGTMTMTVVGQTGQGKRALFTPATDDAWRPDVFVLESTNITIANSVTTPNELFFDNLGGGPANGQFTAIYTFRVAGTTPPVVVEPTIFTQKGGGGAKYKIDPTGLTVEVAAENKLTLEKLVDKPVVDVLGTVADRTVTFTLRFTNAATEPLELDAIIDTLPLLPTAVDYVELSSKFFQNGVEVPIGEPQQSGPSSTVLRWKYPPLIPARDMVTGVDGVAELTFKAVIPAAVADYVNSSTAKIGGEQLDPATATVKARAKVDLSIEKTGDTVVVAGWDTPYHYTITVMNPTNYAAEGVYVDDLWPSDLGPYIVSPPGTTTVDPIGGGFRWNIGTLAANTPITLDVSFLVPATTLPNTVTNTATVFSDFDQNPSNDTSSVITDILGTDLAVVKTGPSDVVAGWSDPYTYTITVTNLGLGAAQGVQVQDAWPAAFSGPTVVTPGVVVDISPSGDFLWTIGDMAKDEVRMLEVTFTVPATTPLPVPQTNTAVVSSTTGDPDLSNNTSSVETTVLGTDLKVVKTGPSDVVAGWSDPYTYTITVTNLGLGAAQGVQVQDAWPAAFSGPTVVTPGVVVDISPSGDFLWTIGDMAKDEVRMLEVTFTVPATTPLPVPQTNTAVVSSTTGDPDLSNNTSSVETTVLGTDLKVVKTGPSDVVAGWSDPYTYTITVTNLGLGAAQGVQVQDTWPAAFSGPTVVTPGVVVDISPSGDFLWTIGDMAKDEVRMLEVTFTVPATTPLPVPQTNTAVVSSTTGDPDLSNNTSSVETTVLGTDLKVVKTGPSDVVAGWSDPYTYTITVTNLGLGAAQGVQVQDTWPAAFSGPTVVTPGVVVDISPSGDFLWTIGDMAKDEVRTLEVTFTVPATTPLPVPQTNTAVVSSTTGDPDLSNNTSSVITQVVGQPVLTITKIPTVQGTNAGDGKTYFYTITVTNTGGSNANNVVVVDTWPKPAGNIVQGAITKTAGTVVVPDPVIGDFTWTIPTLAPGQAGSQTLTVAYTVPVTALLQDYVNNVQVTSDEIKDPVKTFATTVVDKITPTSDTPALLLGTDDGCAVQALVRLIDPTTGASSLTIDPYPGFRGSVRVASGDVDGDGIADIVVAPGRGLPGLVRVFNIAGQPLGGGVYDFYPFSPKWRGGVEIAVGNVDGTGRNEIITAMSTGRAFVSVFKVNATVDPVPFRSFRPFPVGYTSGVMLTTGDYGTYVNGSWSATPDGKFEIAVGNNAGLPAQVRIFDAAPAVPVLLRSFLPFGPKFRNGLTLSSARFSSATVEDVFVGAGAGGKSTVKIYRGSGALSSTLTAFSTFYSKPNAVLFTAALDLSGNNGQVDSIYGAQGRGGVNGMPAGLSRKPNALPVVGLGAWKPPLRVAPILIRAG